MLYALNLSCVFSHAEALLQSFCDDRSRTLSSDNHDSQHMPCNVARMWQSFSSIQWQWLLSNDVKSRTASAKKLCQVYSASLREYCAMSTRVKRHSGCLINKVLNMMSQQL